MPAGGAILDAGCGTGWLLAALAGRGVDPSRLHGVDLLPERVAAAARRVPAAHVGAGDVRDLPVADGSAALVVLLTVLSSLGSDEDVDRALREAARATAPGGAIAIWEPRRPTPGNRATRRIAPQRIAAALGPPELDRPITVLPPLARRLGRATATAYPLLRRVGPLLTHRLVVARPR